MQLFDDVPVGSLRFFELAEGHEGISYQLSKFNEIGPVRPSTLQWLSDIGLKRCTIREWQKT